MIESIEKNYKVTLMFSAVVSALAVIFSYIFKSSFAIFSVLGLILGIVSYASARHSMSEEEVELNFKYMGLSIVSGVCGIIHQIFYSSIYKSVMKYSDGESYLSEVYANMAGTAFWVSFIINAILIVFLIVYLRDEERKEKLSGLKDISFKPIDGKVEEVSKVNPDIVLCKNAETGEDVIWPHSDRYTHALCLGPCETFLRNSSKRLLGGI